MKPLEGIRVIELATHIATPSCGRQLAYLGAEVIKVESLGGEPYRHLTAFTEEKPAVFDVLNAQKKSVSMNLKDPEAFGWFKKLLATADVFLSNVRTAALERLHLRYEEVREINPAIVYAHFSGYGTAGPLAALPGYDATAFCVRNGLYRDFTPPAAEPSAHVPGLGDISSGLALTMNILAALFKKQRTGEGEWVECSLNETATWILTMPMVYEQFGPMFCREEGNPSDIANANARCKDGEWIYFSCGTYSQWLSFCTAIGSEYLKTDPRCTTLSTIIDNTPSLIEEILEKFKAHTAQEWVDIFRSYDVPCERHRHIVEMSSDEQLIANGFIQPLHYDDKTIMVPVPPVKMAHTDLTVNEHGPEFGADTAKVLGSLGCEEERIAEMAKNGQIIAAGMAQ